MGAGAMTLPEGFVLDAPVNSAPALPDGFVLDAPTSNLTGAITDIPKEIGSAFNSAASTIGSKLNPFSDENRASILKQANAPSFMAGMGEQLNRTLGTGAGLAAIPEAASAPLTGTARSVIGHPYAALTGMPYEQAKEGVDLAMMGMRPGAKAPVSVAAPSASDLKAAATAGYDAAKTSGVEFKPSSIENFTSKVQSDLNADGLNEILAPKTFGVLDKLGKPPEGAIVTTNDYRTMQRALGNAAKSIDPTEKLAATRAIEALNDHIENIPASDLIKGTPADAAQVSATIKEANANYAASKRSDLIQGKEDRAILNAGTANSGQNLDNALRVQVKSILTNPKALRGFSDAEKSQMMQIAKGSAPANVVRAIGNLLGGGGGIGTIITAGAGGLAAGPAGVAAPLAGFAVKKIGNAMTSRAVSKLDELVRSRSPLAKQQLAQALASSGQGRASAIQGLMSAAFLQDPSGQLNRWIASTVRGIPYSGPMPASADSDQQQ